MSIYLYSYALATCMQHLGKSKGLRAKWKILPITLTTVKLNVGELFFSPNNIVVKYVQGESEWDISCLNV